jgi:hypothetical protein
MTIGLGIAYGAVALRVAAFLNGEGSGRADVHFTVEDFRLAFLFAGLLTLLSVWGYFSVAHDAGRSVGGGSLRPASPKT